MLSRNLKALGFVLLFSLALYSMGLAEQRKGEIEIRIENRSDVSMENVRVGFSSQTEDYGTIAAREVTEYRNVRKAYRYARSEATVEGKPAVLQPMDFSGEKELKAGKYTYVLKVNRKATSEFTKLRLECRKD
jgi:hypothetical protein